MSYQILGAQHLLNGNGLSQALINSKDLSQSHFIPLNQWPPGFSLLFIPFYLLMGKNYILAAITIGIIFSVLLIFICRSILKKLGLPLALINLFTLLTGWWSYYFYTLPCTDAVGITIFMSSILFTLKLLSSKKRNTSYTAGLIVTLLAAGFFKYLYILPALCVPVYIILKGYWSSNRSILKSGLISFLILILVFGSFLLLQRMETGNAAYIKSTARGFYPENLKAFFPFVSGSFMRPDTLQSFLNLNSETENIVFNSFQIISLAGLLLILFIFLKSNPIKRIRESNLLNDFFQLALFISLPVLAILTYLSLRVGKEIFDFGNWTYVQEPRYFGIAILLIQLSLFAVLHYCQKTELKKLRLLFLFFLLFMIPDFARGVFFTLNRVKNFNSETYGWQQELAFQKKADSIIRQLASKNPADQIVLTGTSDWMTNRAALYSRQPVFSEVQQIRAPESLKTTHPVTMVAIIKDEDKSSYQSFISLPTVKYEGEEFGFGFYSYRLVP